MDTRSNVVAVRFNQNEFKAVERMARKEKLVLASFVRRQIMLEAEKVGALQEEESVTTGTA
jgi:hypothetical protein